MGVRPLNLKRNTKSNVIEVQDEDEEPVVQRGPTIQGSVSAKISIVREERVAKYSDWYINRPLPPDPNSGLPIGAVPKVQNIVATVNMGCPLNLKDVAMRSTNCEYKPQKFTGLIMKLRKPKSTGLLFSTGKVVIAGSKSLEASMEAGRMFEIILRKAGYAAKVQDHKIQNVVANCSFNFPIRLQDFYEFYKSSQNVVFDDNDFPGLTLKLTEPKACVLIFSSGKLVANGLKSFSTIKEVFLKAYDMVLQFKRQSFKEKKMEFYRVDGS